MIFRFPFIKKTVQLLICLKDTNNLILSNVQCATVSKCIDFIVLMGFTPCLLPSVRNSFKNKQSMFIQHKLDISSNEVTTTFLF